MMPESIPLIRRSVSVSWNQETAFRRFTEEFGSWWPGRTHSIGGEKLQRIVFEQHVGGRIYEEHQDGRRFQWGEVILWEPPNRLKFTWHPSRDPSSAQEVEIEFLKEDNGTKLQLTSTGWERWGKGARRARKAYDFGWGYVLNVWAGRRTTRMSVLDKVAACSALVMKLRGGREAEIARAGGEMKRFRKEVDYEISHDARSVALFDLAKSAPNPGNSNSTLEPFDGSRSGSSYQAGDHSGGSR